MQTLTKEDQTKILNDPARRTTIAHEPVNDKEIEDIFRTNPASWVIVTPTKKIWSFEFYTKQRLDAKKEALQTLLETIIKELPGNQAVKPEVQILMACSLADFSINAIDKFIKGQIEHAGDPEGNDLRDRDLDKEIRNEQIDLFWYQSGKTWPAKTNKKIN